MNKHRIGALIAAMALTLTFAGTALAATETWGGNGYPVKENCDDAAPGTTVWIWTGDSPTGLTINGQAQPGEWVQSGGGSWKFVTDWLDSEPDHDTTFVTFTGDDGVLTITHGCAPETTTTTSEETTTTDETTTTSETTTTDETTTTVETTTSETTTFETTTTDTTTVVEAFSVEPAVCRLDDPTSRIQIRRLVGLIALTDLDFFIDGIEITAADIEFDGDDEAFIPVSPGVHNVTITDGEAVLFDEDVDCPECFGTVTTTTDTTPGGSVEELTPPSTDTLGASTSPSSVSTSLLLVLAGALATALVVIPAAARKRR